MRIFITGASGFIGRHLLPLFSPEDELYILTHQTAIGGYAFQENVCVLCGSLQGPMRLFAELQEIKPDVCIHLAWEGIPDFSYQKSQLNLVLGTVLFEMLVESGCKKIISTGSCFEYGMAGGIMYEEDECKLNSYFSWAKNSLMEFGMMLARKHDINFIWPRLFYVYGPGQRSGSLIPTLVNNLKQGIVTPLKNPHLRNDYVHVRDVAEILVKMAKVDTETGIYNIGSGEGTSTWTICQAVEEALGMERDNTRFSYPPDVDKGVVNGIVACLEKIKCEHNWWPKISIEEGIRDYIKNTP